MERSYQQMPSQYSGIRREEQQSRDTRVQTNSAKEQSEDDQVNEEVPLLIALEDGVYVIDRELDQLE